MYFVSGDESMEVGDVVVRKSYGRDVTFKIIDKKVKDGKIIYTLKGINLRIVADAPEADLERASDDHMSDVEIVFSRQVNSSIRHILKKRMITGMRGGSVPFRATSQPKDELVFGRPGKILHVDGDAEYLDACLKVYKQLSLEVVGKMVPEVEQPKQILQLVKTVKPDIVVITGHDALIKGAKDYTDLNNYKNSKHFVDAVSELRNFRGNYDDLVIFAGACQSCYEAILDAGANFASSPARVLIHCLDPVFLCEKVAYANIDKIVSIQEALENTITGTKGIGGLQTRGKYREGFPKSQYVQ